MKTYTFKIKIDDRKIVAAVHMQLEQFYDSIKLTDFSKLLEQYPDVYITACDYETDDKSFVFNDYKLCNLVTLVNSKTLKDWLINPDFLGFIDSLEVD